MNNLAQAGNICGWTFVTKVQPHMLERRRKEGQNMTSQITPKSEPYAGDSSLNPS